MPPHHPLDQGSLDGPSRRLTFGAEVTVTSSKDCPLDNTKTDLGHAMGPLDGRIMKTVHITQSIV
jgi:hypothetical protein